MTKKSKTTTKSTSILHRILKPKAFTSVILIIISCIGLFYLSSTDFYRDIKEVLSNPPFILDVGKTRYSAYLIIKSIIILIIFLWVTGLITDFGAAQIQKFNNMTNTNKTILIKLFKVVVYALGFLIAIQILGLNLTSFAIFSGAIGIGLGFGLQKVTSNFISGFILLFEKTIKNDDLVELTDGTLGYVRRMSARYILIESLNGKKIMVPNETFITNQVTNWTYHTRKARVDINVGIGYDDDISLAIKLLKEAAAEHPKCLKSTAPSAFATSFGDNAINLTLYFWVADVTEGSYGPKSDVMVSILKKFSENRISIPYPQTEMRLIPQPDAKPVTE